MDWTDTASNRPPNQRAGAPAAKVMPTPFARRMSDNMRGHIVAISGEFVGTIAFLWLAFAGAQTANNIPTSSGQAESAVGSNPQQLLYISLVFGFSLAVNAWIFFRISGGLFNPAVTLAMVLIGALGWFRGAMLVVTQIVAAIAAAGLASAMFPGQLSIQTALSADTSIARGVFIEALLTAELIFAILMLAAEKHRGTFIAPLGIGLTLFVCHLAGVDYTGASLNPARSFGPAVINRSFEGYHWSKAMNPSETRTTQYTDSSQL